MNKLNMLDRAYFISIIFTVPFFVELTNELGFLVTTGLVVLYAVVGAKLVRKLSSYFYQTD